MKSTIKNLASLLLLVWMIFGCTQPLAVAGKDPRLYASAERGQRAVEFQLERMTEVLREALEIIN